MQRLGEQVNGGYEDDGQTGIHRGDEVCGENGLTGSARQVESESVVATAVEGQKFVEPSRW
ncbi:hypothetical protein GCM10020255_027910 [Rhodococcus baikonurensis]